MSETPTRRDSDSYAALRSAPYRWLLVGRFGMLMTRQIIGVAIGWEIYERTQNAAALGFIGLIQVLPAILLAIPAGNVVDRYNRRTISIISQFFLLIASLWLIDLSVRQGDVSWIYLCLFLLGTLRTFVNPAVASLTAYTVESKDYPNAAMWNSTVMEAGFIIGPVLAGAIIGIFHTAAPAYALSALFSLVSLVAFMVLPNYHTAPSKEPATWKTMIAGITFVRSEKILLSATMLDLFAVLFGGATALMPVFAKDILHVGPEGLGWLRAAPSVGAMLTALIQTRLAPSERSGRVLLIAVFGFGLATLVFGLSRSFPLSLFALFMIGVTDNFSVVIRSTLQLTRTPDEMRGRVTAVIGMFVWMSNELGQFESGTVAAALIPLVGLVTGTTLSVVTGGIGTLIVVATVAYFSPQLRNLGRLV